MRTASELRARAENAEQLARRSVAPADRAQLLEIARAWHALADAAETPADRIPPSPQPGA
jgi:hypothetical protein